MKIIHITVARKLTNGQKKQLMSEYEAASELPDITWKTLAYDGFEEDFPFSKRIPFPFRGMFARNIYGWIASLYYSRKYDFVLLRHMTFDPFSFIFAPLFKNRISVHHAKEVEELKIIRRDWRGRFASALERKSGAFALRRAAAIIGVTNEIANYEKDRSNARSSAIAYPNGINTAKVSLLEDDRDPHAVNIGFICGTFAAWHGLDKLIEAVKSYSEENREFFQKIGKIHLIGGLSQHDHDIIISDDVLNGVFCIHGFLKEEEYRKILDKCDIGLSSFAMDREGLTEGCTLKVRELLAMGLPIYSGHRDCAIASDFEYYRMAEEIDVGDMISFGFEMKHIDRGDVSSGSRKFIDKKYMMSEVVSRIGGI